MKTHSAGPIFNLVQNNNNNQNQNGIECEPLIIQKEYGYVVIGVAAVCFLCVLLGYVVAGRLRKKIFTKEFMSQFEAIHSIEHKSDITKQAGYPDMGSGLYAQKLPYSQWREFNIGQRVHQQFLENLTPMVIFILLGGFYYTKISIGLCIGAFLSRLLYCFYLSDTGFGNPVRSIGALGTDIVILVGVTTSVMSGLKILCLI